MTKFALYESPFGKLVIRYAEDVVVGIDVHLVEDPEEAEESPLTALVASQLDEYFAGERKAFDFPMALSGTDFQKSVWKALQAIPYGETQTYGEIARAIGNPKAARAVGMANNRNPISIVVPCHRVIGVGGKLVGYGGGLKMKEGLLDLERANS